MTFYDDLREDASDIMAELKQGVVEFVKITSGGGPVNDPGAPVETVYVLDATSKGVSAKYVDGSSVVTSDLEVTASVLATRKSDGVVETVRFAMGDHFFIDGARHDMVRDLSTPAAGDPVALKAIVRTAAP